MPKRKLPKIESCFAENLKRIRLSAKVTQEYMAKRIGVTRTAYTKWETGVSEPSFACLARIIEIFNEFEHLSIDYNALFKETDREEE